MEVFMSNPVLDAIADRRSIRAYTGEQLTGEQLDAILKAARESPSAVNAQPWHFSVVQKSDICKEINEETKKNLAGMNLPPDIFFAAPTVIFLSCDAESRWGRLDCGIAVQNIALAAHSLGLGSVILGRMDAAFTGPRKDYFNRLLKFPTGHDFAIAIAIGVPAASKEAHPQKPDRITFI
jgi:nitroreductase